jgi:multiple sugar transport system ATP-binding protein
MAELVIKNLTKKFGDKTVLSEFNLKVEPGQFLVLVGPSGSGKSTILRLISGLEQPTGGEIWLGGKLINQVFPKDRDLAMVFQNYALYPHLTVFDNIAFPLKLRRVNKTEIEKRVKEVADLLNLEETLDRKPATLSGGQRQRVALGRAIIRQPKVFLFDEPLSNLDAQLRTTLRAELLKLQRRLNTTSVYVTHDQLEAMTLGDKVVVLQNGKSQQEGTPADLYNRPANKFVAEFIGSPGMNFLSGKINQQKMFVNQNLNLSLPNQLSSIPEGKEVWLGVRPEDILLSSSEINQSLTAKLEYLEPTGGESYLYLNLNGVRLVSKYIGDKQFRPGDVIQIAFNSARFHLFDKITGLRLNR